MDMVFSVTKRLLPLIIRQCQQGRLKQACYENTLSSIGFDGILNVIKFLDGESVFYLAHANSFYKQCVSHQSLWKHCTIDLQRVPFLIILSLLQNYGHMISTLVLHGSASACDRERLFYMIHKYCPNLQYLNSFGVPYLISVNDKVTSFSLTFPSCVSDYITLNNLNERYVMYSPTDCIVQSMEIHNQDLHLFSKSIWQFEIENNVEKGFTTSFQCFVNDVPVGSFTLEDSSVASIYTINLLFPVPEHALSKKYHNLTLSIRCKNQLPFGAGYVVISGIGRVTFLRADNTCKIDPIAPAFVAPSF